MKLTNCSNADICYYQVQKGDNLNTITFKFNITSDLIIRNNCNIDLYDGEVIKIVRNAHTLHIVKPVDNIEKIAKLYNVEIDDLVKLNNLNSNRVFVGQVIQIPKR